MAMMSEMSKMSKMSEMSTCDLSCTPVHCQHYLQMVPGVDNEQSHLHTYVSVDLDVDEVCTTIVNVELDSAGLCCLCMAAMSGRFPSCYES